MSVFYTLVLSGSKPDNSPITNKRTGCDAMPLKTTDTDVCLQCRTILKKSHQTTLYNKYTNAFACIYVINVSINLLTLAILL